MTVFDPLDSEALGGAPTMSHIGARQEYRLLAEVLSPGRAGTAKSHT